MIGQFSLYNQVVPGRERLPFGENPAEAYNLSTFQLEAMFASHQVTQAKADDEFRVIVIGDSSVLGNLTYAGRNFGWSVRRDGVINAGWSKDQSVQSGLSKRFL